jgi:hypothetical protein
MSRAWLAVPAAAVLCAFLAVPAANASTSPPTPSPSGYVPAITAGQFVAIENWGLGGGAECCYGVPAQWVLGSDSAEALITVTPGTWQVYEDQSHEGQCMAWNNAEAAVVDQNCTSGATWQLWRSKYLPNVGGGVWEIWNDWEVINRNYVCRGSPGSYNAVITANVHNGPMFLDCPEGSGGTSFTSNQLWVEIGP